MITHHTSFITLVLKQSVSVYIRPTLTGMVGTHSLVLLGRALQYSLATAKPFRFVPESEMGTTCWYCVVHWSICGKIKTLQGGLLDLLDEEFPLVLGGLAVLGADDAGGPV